MKYIVPFYKDKFVTAEQVVKWFRHYNNFYMNIANKKKLDYFVAAPYCPGLL